MGRKVTVRNPNKLVKLDQPWVEKLGKKRAKFVRKVVNKMHGITSGAVNLPFDIPMTSVDIVSKTKEESWLHDKKQETMRLLVRLKDLDEDGLGRHLTPTAKVVQWILWVPLIGDPVTSRSAPDRVWRESTFATPADFLLSYVATNKAVMLSELVEDRWDTGMMLGGAHIVRKLIDEHIRDDNDHLRECITQWLKPLKWHQEWDWEILAESCMFGTDTAPKFDIFWETDSYKPSESFNLTHIWSPGQTEVANTIRDTLATVPGNEKLAEELEGERAAADAAGSTNQSMATSPSDKSSVPSSTATAATSAPRTPVRIHGWTGTVSPLSMRKVARFRNSFATPSVVTAVKPKFRPDQPFDGANKLAFETYFQKQSPYLSGRKKRIRDYQFGAGNSKKAKTGGFFPGASRGEDEKEEDASVLDLSDSDTPEAPAPKRVAAAKKKTAKRVRSRAKRKCVRPRAPKRTSRRAAKSKSKSKSKSRSKSKSKRTKTKRTSKKRKGRS